MGFRAATEGERNSLKGLDDFDLKAKARIWPCLSYMRRVRSNAVRVWDLWFTLDGFRMVVWGSGFRVSGVQEYLAHKKQSPPRTLQKETA